MESDLHAQKQGVLAVLDVQCLTLILPKIEMPYVQILVRLRMCGLICICDYYAPSFLRFVIKLFCYVVHVNI